MCRDGLERPSCEQRRSPNLTDLERVVRFDGFPLSTHNRLGDVI
jgi:hypothetical protein